MRPGKLKHRLAIQTNTTTRDAYGELADSWGTIATVYGRLEPLTSLERLAAGKDTPAVTHRAIVRHRGIVVGDWTYANGGAVEYATGALGEFAQSGVGEAQRVSYDSRTFDVISVQDVDERHRWDRMILREVV